MLVTGANGFVGSAVMNQLQGLPGKKCIGAIRDASSVGSVKDNIFGVGHIDAHTDWRAALGSAGTVVHTAAVTYGGGQLGDEQKSLLTKVNVDGTLALARQAASNGVHRFIFLSSVKIHGEESLPGRPFSASTPANPRDDYAVSKWQAEQGLREIGRETGMDIVVVRPPLIYGPGVKGNFASLINILAKGIPLPFGAIENSRSLVSLPNLVGLIVRCIDHPGEVNQAFLVSDNEDVSTPELLRKLAYAMEVRPRLLAVPPKLLLWGVTLLGKKDHGLRLLGNLQLDITDTVNVLDWEPPVSLQQGLEECVGNGGYE
ncbi:NAD-dependent dehydratase [Marinobacter similis]|uniref:NAD-dependent dehydratase n=1 Tax=Marinobacter similis TaxID=1420916 RepID=W5YRM7_9GAMM|nr:NAD-dependent dehydratase [Marinobacter similis]